MGPGGRFTPLTPVGLTPEALMYAPNTAQGPAAGFLSAKVGGSEVKIVAGWAEAAREKVGWTRAAQGECGLRQGLG